MTNTELQIIAHDLIAARIAKGDVIKMEWAVEQLIKERGPIDGEGAEFYELCAREYVYRIMKRVVDDYDASTRGADTPQMILAGFEHLQKAYTVERNNLRVLVPVDLLTDEELWQRAEQYDKLSVGLKDHANEIRQFISERASKNKSA